MGEKVKKRFLSYEAERGKLSEYRNINDAIRKAIYILSVAIPVLEFVSSNEAASVFCKVINLCTAYSVILFLGYLHGNIFVGRDEYAT